MATFAYTALDAAGRTMTGTIPADSRAAAMDEVISKGLSPISIEERRSAAAAAAALPGSAAMAYGPQLPA